MRALHFVAVLAVCSIAAFSGAFVGVRSLPQRALADLNVGNGSAALNATGSSQTGADPGGGICSSGGAISLCNPISGTTTFSNANPFAFSNTAGPTIVTSAVTTGASFQLKSTGSGTGDLFELTDKTGVTNCVIINNGGNVTISSNCGGGLTVAGTFTPQKHVNVNSAQCAAATPQTQQMGCRITASSSAATLTFTTAFTNTPICVATDETTVTSAVKVTPSTTNVVLATPGASDVVDVVCFGNLS